MAGLLGMHYDQDQQLRPWVINSKSVKTHLVGSSNLVLKLSAQLLARHLQMQVRSWPGAPHGP